MEKNVTSPLIKNGRVKFIRKYATEKIINRYKSQFNIDVQHFFNDLTEISLYECESSGYQFYYPLHLGGDDSFYQELQNFEWYYMPWKWEHEVFLKLIDKREKILEVGSGGLGFISRLHDEGYDITGLELNTESKRLADEKGIDLRIQSIQSHSKEFTDHYEVCCSFQVCEHISEVYSFIEAQVNCLRKEGKLIISVPNNDSFLRYDKEALLNLPPHHMGKWHTSAFKNLEAIFPLKLKRVIYEPLRKYHVDWYVTTMFKRKLETKSLLFRILNKLKLKGVFKLYVKLTRRFIKGHTILVVFSKL